MEKFKNSLEEIKPYTKNINSKENSSLKRIGNLIKEARLNTNQSIDELAYNLKIGGHQLKAIENGNKDQLPEEVFIKAMVRRISEKLKLDTEFIMREFNDKKEEVKIEEIIQEDANKSQNHKQIKNQNPIGFAIFIFVSGIFGLLASSFIFNIFSDPFQNRTPIQDLIQKN